MSGLSIYMQQFLSEFNQTDLLVGRLSVSISLGFKLPGIGVVPPLQAPFLLATITTMTIITMRTNTPNTAPMIVLLLEPIRRGNKEEQYQRRNGC